MFELEIFSKKDKKEDKINSGVESFGIFKKILESLSDIVEQMEMKISQKGLHIQVMDSMHVALADVFLSSELFSTFRADRELQLGIPLKTFLQILKTINMSEGSTFSLSCEDTPESLKLCFKDESTKLETEILLFQIGSENYELPDLEYSSSISLPTSGFRNFTKTVGNFGDYISFAVAKDEMIVSQDGDMAKVKLVIKSNETNTFIASTEPVCLELAKKYVDLINKVSTIAESMVISMQQEAPIFFDMKLFNKGYIRFYVAPKMG